LGLFSLRKQKQSRSRNKKRIDRNDALFLLANSIQRFRTSYSVNSAASAATSSPRISCAKTSSATPWKNRAHTMAR